MADKQGHKAELDKDGIPLAGAEKAELDKDGIPLESGAKKKASAPGQPPKKIASQATALTEKSRLPIILIGTGAGVLVAALAIVLVLTLGDKPEPQPEIQPQPQTRTFSEDGEIILDPFMVTYKPLDEDKSGVLIAQVSLEVEPRSAANVRGQTFQIRALILERLSTNAQVYSKKELADLIEEDLAKFKIKNVSFLRYDLR